MAKELRAIAGRVVAVTGGARGIGRATAEALARRGARVAIGDLDGPLTEQAAAGIGGGAIGMALDVCAGDSFARFLEETESRLGPLDVLVNNAGIMHLGPFLEEDDAAAMRQVDVNLHGVIIGSRLALRRFVPRRTGHLVNVASGAGMAPLAGAATYSATKHAVVGLSGALREEARDHGVEVSVVLPAVVNTELASGFGTPRGLKRIEPADVAEGIARALELPRYEVFVPRALGATLRGGQMLPRRLAEGLGRAMGGDRLMVDVDRGERAEYERRAARSERGLEAGEGAGATGEQGREPSTA
jgi:NAD(P)-dependent dehydrogenase (short-subunit alcohol dehydrogenase family)